MNSGARKPQAFTLDDAAVKEALDELEQFELPANPKLPDGQNGEGAEKAPGLISWPGLFWAGVGGFLSFALGIWAWGFIEVLFSRYVWLGWLGAALISMAAAGLFGMIMREWLALRRLAALDALRARAVEAGENRAPKKARAVVHDMGNLYSDRPDLAQGRAALRHHEDEIVDGPDLLKIAEQDLMLPLDVRAAATISASARRVSVVTALSPRALIDVLYVFWETIRLLRKIGGLYGGRPGTLALIRLIRHALGNLAATGTVAIGDSFIEQLLGHGVTAKLSARLGEGVFNGFLIARFGIAAMHAIRPLPFLATKPPKAAEIMKGIVNLQAKA